MKGLEYFTDEKLTIKETTDALQNVVSNFGLTEPGNKYEKKLYVRNSTKFPMKLKPFSEDESLKITEYPRTLLPSQSEVVILEYNHEKDRIEPLQASWGFEVHVGY